MFIASTTRHSKGRTLLILGLSEANRDRLADGEPIALSRETHGLAIPEGLDIVIFAGESEETMRDDLSAYIGPNTVLNQFKPQ